MNMSLIQTFSRKKIKKECRNQTNSSSTLSYQDHEGKTCDSLPYPNLRPIIISRSRDSKRSHDHNSPCVPPTMRGRPWIRRPPSPVVPSVPRAPRPPLPSPVSDSRRHRGFPTVRYGSSSPRHWGMRGWFHDGTNLDEACLRMDGAEVVWSFRSNNISGQPLIQPLLAPLLQDRLMAIPQLARDQEHLDVALPIQPPELHNCPTRNASLSRMHSLLHDEIEIFCKKEPIKEAGILEDRNGIKETCLRYVKGMMYIPMLAEDC